MRLTVPALVIESRTFWVPWAPQRRRGVQATVAAEASERRQCTSSRAGEAGSDATWGGWVHGGSGGCVADLDARVDDCFLSVLGIRQHHRGLAMAPRRLR